jgi:hypothetical protein
VVTKISCQLQLYRLFALIGQLSQSIYPPNQADQGTKESLSFCLLMCYFTNDTKRIFDSLFAMIVIVNCSFFLLFFLALILQSKPFKRQQTLSSNNGYVVLLVNTHSCTEKRQHKRKKNFLLFFQINLAQKAHLRSPRDSCHDISLNCRLFVEIRAISPTQADGARMRKSNTPNAIDNKLEISNTYWTS